MTVHPNSIRRIWSSLIAISLMLSFAFSPTTPFFETRKAEAHCHGWCASEATQLVDTAIDKLTSAASIASKIFDGITSKAAASLALKEFTLDGIAWALINTMIQQMSRSIITWINSGFKGSPAFVTDLKGFLLDVMDITAGRFLTDLGLGIMCSPFKLNVQISLALQYQSTRRFESQCRLSQVVSNIENFFKGDIINNGGWGSWFALTTVPSNNPYGALLEAQHAFEISLTNARGQQVKLLDFGRGFLSFNTCGSAYELPQEGGGAQGAGPKCTVTTPGAVIESQLNNVLDSGRNRLVIADEINEILAALFAQLVNQVFSGVGGLLGLTKSGYQGTGFSYVQAISMPSFNPTSNNGGLTYTAENPIASQILVEKAYVDAQKEVVSRVDSAEAYANSLFGTVSHSPLPGSLETARTNAKNQITAAEALIVTLQAIEVDYKAATDPDAQYKILNDFLALQGSGSFHHAAQVEMIKVETIGNEYFGLVYEINNYQAQIYQEYQDYLESQNKPGSEGPGSGDD